MVTSTPNICCPRALARLTAGDSSRTCSHCGQTYQVIYGIVDLLDEPSEEVIAELQGMAEEKGVARNEYERVKIQPMEHVPTLDDLQSLSTGSCELLPPDLGDVSGSTGSNGWATR
ncbi:MAG: hypothetical protein ACRD0Z_15635 [Acidimicrobiales bacterium]